MSRSSEKLCIVEIHERLSERLFKPAAVCAFHATQIFHESSGESSDEGEEYTVEDKVYQVKVLPVRMPFHLEVLLRERMSQKFYAAVGDHSLGTKTKLERLQ